MVRWSGVMCVTNSHTNANICARATREFIDLYTLLKQPEADQTFFARKHAGRIAITTEAELIFLENTKWSEIKSSREGTWSENGMMNWWRPMMKTSHWKKHAENVEKLRGRNRWKWRTEGRFFFVGEQKAKISPKKHMKLTIFEKIKNTTRISRKRREKLAELLVHLHMKSEKRFQFPPGIKIASSTQTKQQHLSMFSRTPPQHITRISSAF